MVGCKIVYLEERPATVQRVSNGIAVKRPRMAGVKKVPFGYKRPKMDGRFSRTSALNLRKKLACLPSETYRLWGVTLTIPAQCYKDPADFRKLWVKFTASISNRIKGLRGDVAYLDFGFLWRVELTTGENLGKVRTPHYHCVLWTNDPADVLQFGADWCAAVERHYQLECGTLSRQIAAQAQELTTCQAAFQYVANHTSKHKAEQLGWPGRQWGVYYGTRENRRKMSPILNRLDDKPLDVAREEVSDDTAKHILVHGNTQCLKNPTIK